MNDEPRPAGRSRVHATSSCGTNRSFHRSIVAIALTTVAVLAWTRVICAQDFSDAPAPYTFAENVAITDEWMFNGFLSSTTAEAAPLRPDLDLDDAGALLYCLSAPVGGVCPGAMAVAVGVAPTAPDTIRRLNVVADMNGNGVFGDIYPASPAREHVVRDLPVAVPPGTWAWIVAVGFDLALPPAPANTMWVRATLTRGIINDDDWDGAGIFPYGETEDFAWTVSQPVIWPPPMVLGTGGPGGNPKTCVNPLPQVVGVTPNPVVTPVTPGSVTFSVDACDAGCCTRIDIFNCRAIRGAPGPNCNRDPLDVLGAFCALPANVLTMSPPGTGIVAGAGQASSASKPTNACAGFPTNYGFVANYPAPPDQRVWRCTIRATFDPEGDTVHLYDLTPFLDTVKSEVTFIELSESYCGDGIVVSAEGEECDPPGQQSAYCAADEVCGTLCECVPRPEDVCGNAVIEGSEVCDPPLEQDGCTDPMVCNADCSDCTTCGNGTLDAGEVCDPSADPDNCSPGEYCVGDCSACLLDELCGNDQIDTGEVCDGVTGCPPGEVCDTDCSVCEPVGACCFPDPDARCFNTTPSECLYAGGDFAGDGTTCLGDADDSGTDDACEVPIPTVSEWGFILMGVLILTAGAVLVRSRRTITA